MRRRAVGLRGFIYFVGTHTRSTVPLERSVATLVSEAESTVGVVRTYIGNGGTEPL